jgi:undecaprenyl diphosphate synthase
MVQEVAEKTKQGIIDPESIDEELISGHLYTHDIPDPDLLIRTSGEMRISNFLLWQIAYTELFVTPTLWPDFNKAEFLQILKDFSARVRRFGVV